MGHALGKPHARRLLVLAALVALAMPAGAAAGTLHTKLLAKAGYGSTPVAFARTADGALHVVIAQNTNWGDSFNGIAEVPISTAGLVGATVQAWTWSGQAAVAIPGLAVLPGGALEATWGGVLGSDGPWGISSSDGGTTWSAPVNIGSGLMAAGDSHVDVAVSNGTPVLAAGCCGNLVVQQGFGSSSPTYQLTNSTDGCAANSDLATDAVTGATIASWDSCEGSGGLWLQQVAPSAGAPTKLPVPTQYGTGEPAILAARGSAPGGVFAAYPANYSDTTHIDLYRYGGGSTSVGAVHALHADVWGVATGSDGRLWVMWYGQNTKTGRYEIAVTRSNKEISAYERVQVFSLNYSSMNVLEGDGSLGALDMLINGTPGGNGAAAGIYYARVIPVLTAHISAHGIRNASGNITSYGFRVKVTDAGDPVSGAKVTSALGSASTNKAGIAHLKMNGVPGGHRTFAISAPTYHTLSVGVALH